MSKGGVDSFFRQDIGNRSLKRRRHIRNELWVIGLSVRLPPSRHRGFQPRKREVVAVGGLVFWLGESTRKVVGRRIASGGDPINLRTSRVGQPQHAGHLVKRLTRCVIDGVAQHLHVVDEVSNQK